MGKLVYDIGIHNKGIYTAYVNNKPCKEYDVWAGLLERCQPNGKYQQKKPSYAGCSVHSEFIHFQDFAKWCNKQIGFGNTGWALDKDILVQGNKVYGPDTCCFVPHELNSLLNHKRISKGEYPTGVSFHQKRGVFYAQLCIDGINKTLGIFKTQEDAFDTYRNAKVSEIHRKANHFKEVIDSRVYNALMNYTV